MIPARLPPMLLDREPNSFAWIPRGPWYIDAAAVYSAGPVRGDCYTPSVTGETYTAGAEAGDIHA